MGIEQVLKQMQVTEDMRSAFDEHLAEQRIQGLWGLAALGLVFFPIFSWLDYLVRPGVYEQIAYARLGLAAVACLLVIILWRLNTNPILPKLSLGFVFAFSFAYAAALDISIVLAGGLSTPYYAGFNLLIIVLATAVPLRTKHLLILVFTCVAQLNVIDFIFFPGRDLEPIAIANYYLGATVLLGLMIHGIHHHRRWTQFKFERVLIIEKGTKEKLLYNAMPPEVAKEYLREGHYSPRHIAYCSVLFSDFVGFTRLASRISPNELVHGLNRIFSHFDDVSLRHGLERIKTMGDSYMCAGGVLSDQPGHLVRSILVGLEMLDVVDREGMRGPDGTPWRMRVGLHAGPIVAGVVGRRNFAFDLWGDAVNVASRMESHAQAGTINLATDVYETVEKFFIAEERGTIPVRGKGPMSMSQITRLRPRYSFDDNGRLPNDDFYSALDDWLKQQGTMSPVPIESVLPDASVDVSVSDFDPLNAFAMLLPEDHERLRDLAEETAIGEGEVLFHEGQDLSVLYLVIRGLFAVRNKKDGVDIEVAVLGPGELVGELSFVSLEAASATVVALADSAVLRFDLNRLQQMHTDHPGFSARLFHSFALRLARRVRIANAKLHSSHSGRSPTDSGGHGALTSPHIPVALVAAVGDMQRSLRPYMDGTRPEQDLPDGSVARVADRLVSALADQADKESGNLHELGTAIRREAYRFLMRSKLIQMAQGEGVTSHALQEAIRCGHVLSKNSLGRQVEQWFHEQPFAIGIRDATDFVGEFINDKYQGAADAWRLTVLGSGSVGEIFDRIGQLGAPTNLKLTYVNNFVEALSAASTAAEQLEMKERLSLIRLNVLVRGMIRSRLRLVPQDMIVYQTLLQDVPDDALLDLLDEIHALLAPGGSFLLGQLHMPPKADLFLSHVLGTPIYQRGVDAMSDLVSRSAFGGRFEWISPQDSQLASFIELRRAGVG